MRLEVLFRKLSQKKTCRFRIAGAVFGYFDIQTNIDIAKEKTYYLKSITGFEVHIGNKK